jgi:hypothetical protein
MASCTSRRREPSSRPLDATNGQVIWEYKRDMAQNLKTGAKAKTIAIGLDMVYWTFARQHSGCSRRPHRRVALGSQERYPRQFGRRCRRPATRSFRAAPAPRTAIAISPRTTPSRASCVWKFTTAARMGEPGGDSWGGVPDDKRTASTWGLGRHLRSRHELRNLGCRQSHSELAPRAP